MAETTQFVIEGDFTLAYFADEYNSKHVLIFDPDVDPDSLVAPQTRLESKITDELNFPTDEEFNEIFSSLNDMRSKGMRPEEGIPVKTRQTKLRITVEVL